MPEGQRPGPGQPGATPQEWSSGSPWALKARHTRAKLFRDAFTIGSGFQPSIVALGWIGALRWRRGQVSRNLRAFGEQQRRSLVTLNIDTADRLMSERDPVVSLPYPLGSIRLDSSDPSRAALYRIRLGLTLQDKPQLTPQWRHGGAAHSPMFGRDGRRVLSAGDDGTARLGTIARGRGGTGIDSSGARDSCAH